MADKEFKQQLWTMEMLPKDILINKIKKLEQALEEIKEIDYELTNEEYTDFIEGKQKQILEKISEVLDD